MFFSQSSHKFFPKLSLIDCQNNSHKNWQQRFFSNIISKLMDHMQQSWRFVNLYPHTAKFVVLKLLAQKVKMHWVNCKLHLVVIKVRSSLWQLGWASVSRASLFFFKTDSYLPIQAFQKAKEPKDRGWLKITS